MENNISLAASKRKRNKRKKRNSFVQPSQPPPSTNPAATLQGLKTIANLLHIHQQLTRVGQKPTVPNTTDPKPLMSGPRFGKTPMFAGTKIGELRNVQTETKNTPSTSNAQENDSKDINIKAQSQENASDDQNIKSNQKSNTENPSTSSSQIESKNDTVKDKDSNSKSLDDQNIYKQNLETKKPPKLNFVNRPVGRKSFSNKQRQFKFDDFEVYDSPTFINFESTDELVDLNDDDLNKNQTVNKQPGNDNKILKQNINTNFQTKFQEQYAKKLEMKNQSEAKNTSDQKQESPKPKEGEPTGQGEAKKLANKELLEGLSSDIKTVVQENIKTTISRRINNPNTGIPKTFIQQQRRHGNQSQLAPHERPPAGIPLSFLRQQNKTPPQTYSQENPSTSNYQKLDQWMTNQNAQTNVTQMFVQTNIPNTNQPQPYSPTDIYQDVQNNEGSPEGSESSDILDAGQKRVSAFQRLGPLTQPKKPKLTINLSLTKEQPVREVVDETPVDIPVHDREDINSSTDETVVKYLPYWPWKKTVPVKKSVTARTSKTVMMLEKEQMEEIYDKDNSMIMISVTGYPPSWTKENLLDVILENLKGKSFIPCFIEFTSKECKFFVIRCRVALLSIHWLGFIIKKDDVELSITISQTQLPIKQIDFLPRIVLRKRLAMNYDGDKLDLREFTLKSDISHFLYFPLNRIYNQTELIQLHSEVIWKDLTELNLSDNRITTLEGFRLSTTTPHLKSLNLSNNCIDSVQILLPSRNLPLTKLILEGNPLCLDYIDPDYYVKVMKTMFPSLRELDGVSILLKGDIPVFKKNYCPDDAKVVAEKFLEVFFPLLDSNKIEREMVQGMYDDNALMTITCRSTLRYDSNFKYTRNILIKSQDLIKGNIDNIYGASNIGKLIKKWPQMQHDMTTFTTDVMYHDESSTIIKITGIMRITAESLADDEPLVAFSRTILLHTKNSCVYKIKNEMLYWDEPTQEYSNSAFKTITVPRKALSLKFETIPDDDIKKRLVNVFMKITELGEKQSERCLEIKNWHFEQALDYFMKLLKLDNTQALA